MPQFLEDNALDASLLADRVGDLLSEDDSDAFIAAVAIGLITGCTIYGIGQINGRADTESSAHHR